MPRPRTGSTEFRSGRWHARVTLASGERPWIPLDPGLGEGDVEAARKLALQASEDAASGALVPEAVKETVSEYSVRWLASREGRVRTNRDTETRLRLHVCPTLGPLDIHAVGREDVKRLVASLDAKVSAGELRPGTAKHAWSATRSMFDDAVNAKDAKLVCLGVDPTIGVRGPDVDTGARQLQYLYPTEFNTFVQCSHVPRSWRRDVAIAVYLCLRDGELRALAWPSVDLEHGIANVCEVYDRREDEVRQGTKTGAARQVPIPDTLMPLLREMKREAKGRGLVCPPREACSEGLRRWLKNAGVTRPALHKATSASRPLRWHDLRATGATWLAVQGRPATEIRDILGHSQTSMTDRYVRAAGLLRGGRFGEPFPALPVELGFVPESSLDDTASVASLKTSRSGEASRPGWP